MRMLLVLVVFVGLQACACFVANSTNGEVKSANDGSATKTTVPRYPAPFRRVKLDSNGAPYIHDAYDEPVTTVAPRYPTAAARDGVEGYVCFVFDIAADGGVSNLRIYDEKPELTFFIEAARAITQWKFKASGSVRSDRRYCLDFNMSGS